MKKLTPQERRAARTKFVYAVFKGKIKKQPCRQCGSRQNLEGHHPDYSKPFEVIWLCRKHHKELHRNQLKSKKNK